MTPGGRCPNPIHVGLPVCTYVQIEYVCGDDIVAMDYGSDIRGQHGEETAIRSTGASLFYTWRMNELGFSSAA